MQKELKPGDIIKSTKNAPIFGYYIIDTVDDIQYWYRKIVNGHAVLPVYSVRKDYIKLEYYELVYRAQE